MTVIKLAQFIGALDARQGRQVMRTCVLLLFLVVFPPAHAQAATAAICDHAARDAAAASDVPVEVLLAITRTETGRQKNGATQPWPWTVNMEGVGKWFDTEDAARSYVFQHFKRGARSFDVGCFQINYKWHGQAFRSIDEMFDPRANAHYAAAFLTELYSELGNWTDAAGAYHSRTPKYAERYKTRFRKIRAGLTDTPSPDADLPPRQVQTLARVNSYPLLQSGSQSGAMGSLMPSSVGSARSLFATGGG